MNGKSSILNNIQGICERKRNINWKLVIAVKGLIKISVLSLWVASIELSFTIGLLPVQWHLQNTTAALNGGFPWLDSRIYSTENTYLSSSWNDLPNKLKIHRKLFVPIIQNWIQIYETITKLFTVDLSNKNVHHLVSVIF